MGQVLSGDKALANARQLAKLTASNPVARAGVQRAIAEYLNRRFTGTAPAGDTETNYLLSNGFQKFVREKEGPLSALMTPEQLQATKMIAADMRRSQLSTSATKVPGTSNTAHDMHAAGAHEGGQSVAGQMIAAEAAESIAEHAMGGAQAAGHGSMILGPLAAIGTLGLSAMRAAGFRRVADLRTEAMHNPELARTLMQKAQDKAAPSYSRSVARAMRLAGAQQAASAQVPEQRQAPSYPLATPSSAPRYVPGRTPH